MNELEAAETEEREDNERPMHAVLTSSLWSSLHRKRFWLHVGKRCWSNLFYLSYRWSRRKLVRWTARVQFNSGWLVDKQPWAMGFFIWQFTSRNNRSQCLLVIRRVVNTTSCNFETVCDQVKTFVSSNYKNLSICMTGHIVMDVTFISTQKLTCLRNWEKTEKVWFKKDRITKNTKTQQAIAALNLLL